MFDLVEYMWLRKYLKKSKSTEMTATPPLTFQSNGTALKNYRIYGNTVNGESVGDKTKNLLQYPFIFEDNREVNGITYTVNSDKSITVSGSFSGTTHSYYAFSPWWTNNTYNRIPLSAGQTVTFSCRGLPDDWEMIIGFCQSQTGTFDRIGSNVYVIGDNTYTYTADENCFIAFGIYQVTVSSQPGFTCYPQIEIGSIATEYEPYGCKIPVTCNGKDELKNAATSQSINGLTFMVNTDKSITVNGTATETVRLLLGGIRLIKNVPYKISGCPSGGSTNTYRLDPRYTTGSVLIPFIDTGNGSVYTSENDINLNIYIYVQSGYTCDNLTFYPMIRKTDIEDDTYEPYRNPITTNIYLDEPLTEGESISMSDTGIAIPTINGTNILTVDTQVQPEKVYIKYKEN